MFESTGETDYITSTGNLNNLYGDALTMEANSQGGRDTLTATAVIINPF